jgi:flavorubredoxin
LKYWPQKIWKKIILAFVLILIVGLGAFGAFGGLLMAGVINREVVSGIDVINADGSKTALIVYQPGFSSFPRDISYAFADGLASSGWRVEITTASPQSPSDLSKYSLLTLAYPVYGGNPGTAIVNYANRLNDLDGINTVIIACQGGTGPSLTIDTLKQKVQVANGTFYIGLSFSNQNSSAIESARQAGRDIAP